MYVRTLIAVSLLSGGLAAQTPGEPKLKSRDEALNLPPRTPGEVPKLWIVPAGTRIPIELRQPISTKNAKPGDPIYAQTAFPIALDGHIVIPAGTWVQGVVDDVKRAGRIKGRAELQFHLTTLLFSNGYKLDLAAAIDQVPGDETASIKEPDTVERDPERAKDVEQISVGAARGGQIGAIGGIATRSVRGIGAGGLSGIAAGTLIAMLARGSDVRFETGAAVEIALTRAMAIESARLP